MQIANDTTPQLRELTAVERTMRTIAWVTDRLAERSNLKPADREARALQYQERAANFVLMAEAYPTMAEFAGLNSVAASILRAPE